MTNIHKTSGVYRTLTTQQMSHLTYAIACVLLIATVVGVVVASTTSSPAVYWIAVGAGSTFGFCLVVALVTAHIFRRASKMS